MEHEVGPMANRPTEMKIRLPTDFSGDRNRTKEFLLDCKMYLQMNDTIYDTDAKKILFVLSYMRAGTAGPWKEAFYNNATTPQGSLGTYTTFMTAIENAFAPSDEKGEARTKLKTFQMKGGMTADEYIADFRTAASLSGITEDTALIEYFMEGIPTPLMEKISMMDQPLTTIKGWYECTSKYDNQYRRTKAITARLRGNTKPGEKKKYNFVRRPPQQYLPRHDPNAMDVDSITINRLSISERDEHMKKGLCFECHKPGHRASDHKAGTPSTPQKTPLKGKDAYARIRTILTELDEDEKEVALKNMEEEGF